MVYYPSDDQRYPCLRGRVEGEDYNSAKAGGSCKIVKPGRSFCCAAFNLAASIKRSTDTGREVVVLYCLEISSSRMVMFYNALLHEICTAQFSDPDTGREEIL